MLNTNFSFTFKYHMWRKIFEIYVLLILDRMLGDKKINKKISSIIRDIRLYASRFICFECSFVARSGNSLADCIANKAT